MSNYSALFESLSHGVPASTDSILVYPYSYNTEGSTAVVMMKEGTQRLIAAAGSGPLFDELQGTADGTGKICACSTENRKILQKYFTFLVPAAAGKKRASIGLGDRLGRATPGHIEAVKGHGLFPVFAQQSIRELTLTGRTYDDVLDYAVYAVLCEGYKDGFGADGDHLKTEADIRMSLDLGFTMITLDCSEKIINTAAMSDNDVRAAFSALPDAIRDQYANRYSGKNISFCGASFTISETAMMRNTVVYSSAIDFIEKIFATYIKTAGRDIDFEVSIDETSTPTSPEAHFIVANELMLRGVNITSMAPRFCGEFQKGIDYIGNCNQFETEFIAHAAIARHFGYKVSIHSGSDKFSVFPVIAKHTEGLFHVKTAGTNWLEAVKVIALKEPALYREMHQFARDHFEEAKKYYHVTTDLNAIKPLDAVRDCDLVQYMAEDNARQLMHITYGILLNAKTGSGGDLFRKRFFSALDAYAGEYRKNLMSHIGRHIQLLGK